MTARSFATLGVLAAAILLAGCAPNIPGWKIDYIHNYCKERGGVDKMETFIFISGVCRDGKFVTPESAP